MKKLIFVGLLVLASVALAATALADRGKGKGGNNFKASLTGFQETPSESTPGHGDLRLRISGNEIRYRLHYEDFEAAEGSTLFAHIHFGQTRRSRWRQRIPLWAAATSLRARRLEGTIEGVIDAADVVGPAGQGIAAGEMAEFIRAIRKGYTYGNVHTTLNGAGLIRGQIGHGKRHGHK